MKEIQVKAVNFHPQFVRSIKRGTKYSTIRKSRIGKKDETVALKSDREVFGFARVVSMRMIQIFTRDYEWAMFIIGNEELIPQQVSSLLKSEGFQTLPAFLKYLKSLHYFEEKNEDDEFAYFRGVRNVFLWQGEDEAND
jgi:hypothetical protein